MDGSAVHLGPGLLQTLLSSLPILGVLVVETENEPEIIRQGETMYDGATQSV